MNKKREKIKEKVISDQKRIQELGWTIVVCDNWNMDHFLKAGASSLHKKEGQILCRNCILKK